MTTLVDAAPLVALADGRDRLHTVTQEVLEGASGPLVVPAPVSAEADYMLGRRLGRPARLAFLDDIIAGRFEVHGLDVTEYASVRELETRYADLDLGLADCSLVLLAQRLGTRTLVTFDERDFRSVTPLQGGTFELLPTDVGE